MKKLPGISREAEEKRLQDTIEIAEEKVRENERSVRELANELHTMQKEFDENDKDSQQLWHTTDARFKFVNQDLRRAMQARKKPYFGRIDFEDKKIGEKEVYYIGRSVIAKDPANPEVIDWRAPIAGVYYDAALGDVSYYVKGEGRFHIDLTRKRTYEIENDELKDFYDSDVVANDELLTKYLARSKRAVLGEIIATIQQEQNEVIRKNPHHNVIVQGAAGSGKTTVAMHRISYILYNYEMEFAPEDFYIIGSNKVLLNYITGVLPELNVYGVCQMTMEELFTRLLYEDWDKHRYEVKPVVKGITEPVKGTMEWFDDLEQFCEEYERKIIPTSEIIIEKTGALLLDQESIEKIWKKAKGLSRADKIEKLTQHLLSKLENEISGKYYSYSEAEKQTLLRRYETHFGKREWKGSVFDLYEQFLTGQDAKGKPVKHPEEVFDLYDLAALAYLYKRIKEDTVIREAGHVVIDEAQDFGMSVYASLKYCLSKCTYTIMGDVSQNVSMEYGLNDWSDLKTLMLPEEYDYFGLLKKSYRNTVEISEFATNILYHGSFQKYPVEPIIRHGKEVLVEACKDFPSLMEETAKTVNEWTKNGMETVAIVCPDDASVKKVTRALAGKVDLLSTNEETIEFTEGVMVLSIEYTKGLEFDAVVLLDASKENYPAEDAYVKRLYVAATRALHELKVLYTGELTDLISKEVPKEKRGNVITHVENKRPNAKPEESEETNEEKYRRIAREGELERQKRELYGPKKIEVIKKEEVEKEASASKKYKERGITLPENKRDYKIPTYMERMKEEQALRRMEELDEGDFGTIPGESMLYPPGHSKIDTAVKFCMKGEGCLDILSSYGTLRISPISPDIVRISFAKGQFTNFPKSSSKIKRKPVKYKLRENPAFIQLITEKLCVQVEKKTGTVNFMDSKGKVLLVERTKEPRMVTEGKTWEFFEFGKDSNLVAKGVLENRNMRMGLSARYISFGENCEEMPALFSPKGYELIFPEKRKILCCSIPMYGPYIAFENTDMIDYYFKISS